MGALAGGEPRFLPILKSTFHIPAGSESDKAGCNNCHVGPPVRGPFGKQVEAALKKSNTLNLTPEILLSIQNLDADGDGYTNGEELRAGYLPGDPNSHPSKHGDVSHSPTKRSLADLIPKHTYHPALVHFPIALFVFGAVVDVIGVRKRKAGYRDSAFWSYLAASHSLMLVVPTGLISCFRQGYSLTPGQPVFTHFVCAVTAAVGIIASAVWLRKSRPTGFGYWTLIALTAAAVIAAGFFGGALVYG